MTKKKSTPKQIKISQIKSTIAGKSIHKTRLLSLGLKKIGDTKVLQDTKEIRGLIFLVKHLITIEEL